MPSFYGFYVYSLGRSRVDDRRQSGTMTVTNIPEPSSSPIDDIYSGETNSWTTPLESSRSTQSYGVKRDKSLGNSVVKRMFGTPVSCISSRSRPMAKPPSGGMP